MRPVRTRYFFIAAALFVGVGLYAYRGNNIRMLELRAAVFQADETNGDVEGALRELREHVHSHMNTDLAPKEDSIRPPIQLKHRYERLVQAERERVSQFNERVYSEAQADCERRFPGSFYGRDRIPCIEEYIAQNGVTERPISESLYKFDFVSPRWTFDFAGWMLIIGGAFLLLGILRLTLERWVVGLLRRKA